MTWDSLPAVFQTAVRIFEAAAPMAAIVLLVLRRYKDRPQLRDLLALVVVLGGLVGLLWWFGMFKPAN